MKKFIMIFILLFAIFSCGGSDENVKEENSSNIEKTDVKRENQELLYREFPQLKEAM